MSVITVEEAAQQYWRAAKTIRGHRHGTPEVERHRLKRLSQCDYEPIQDRAASLLCAFTGEPVISPPCHDEHRSATLRPGMRDEPEGAA